MSIQDDYFDVRDALKKAKLREEGKAFANIWRVFCLMEEKLEIAEQREKDVLAMRRVLGTAHLLEAK